MNDGLNIRWRQTAPDRSLVALALAELDALHAQWPGTMQCDIVIERAGTVSREQYRAQVAIDFGLVARARGESASAEATETDIAAALRAAFDKLHKQPGIAVAA